jgi:hypothetical protein
VLEVKTIIMIIYLLIVKLTFEENQNFNGSATALAVAIQLLVSKLPEL